MKWIEDPLILERREGRVSLRPLRPSHVTELFAARGDADTWRYLTDTIDSLEEMDRLVERALASKMSGLEYPFVVFDRLRDCVVGSTRYLDLSPVNRSLEIGWTWIEPSARRSSVNTECKFLLLEHAFESLGCVRVQIKTDARNARSRTAIERIGFTHEGILRKHRILPDGFVRDSVYYSMIAEEWPQAKLRLTRWVTS
ncbi:MAG TPA: GNAT family protein [Spirochaetia bacterium]|nr:GNAT family protein [Spirochaetia bacterium]